MPYLPSAQNNWGRPPTTKQLREAGLLIGNYKGIMSPPSPVSEAGRNFGKVDNFYDLQNDVDQNGNLRPTAPRPVNPGMYENPSWGSNPNPRANEPGHSWNTHPSTGQHYDPRVKPAPSIGTTAYSRPATPYEESLLPPPEIMPRTGSATEIPRPPPGFSGSLPGLVLKPNRYGSGSSSIPSVPQPSQGVATAPRKPSVFNADGTPFFVPGNRLFGQGPYAPSKPIVSRWMGGAVDAFQTAIVGERGPEIIVPKQPVEVIPLQGQHQFGTTPETQAPMQEPAPQAPTPQPYEPMPVAESQRFNPTVDMPPTPPTPVEMAPVSFGDPNMQLLRAPRPIPRNLQRGPGYGAILRPDPEIQQKFRYPEGMSPDRFKYLDERLKDQPHLNQELQDYYAAMWRDHDARLMAEEDAADFAKEKRKEDAVQNRFETSQFNTAERFNIGQKNIFTRQENAFKNSADLKKQAADEKKAAEEKAYNDDMEYIGKARELGNFTLEEAEKIAAIKNPILRRSEIKVMEAEKRAIAEERRKQQTNTQEKRAKIAALSEIVRQASDDIKKYRENVTNADGTLGDKNPNADPEAKTKAWERYHTAVLKMIEAGAPAFATPQEAEAAKVPPGTIVIINGRPALSK